MRGPVVLLFIALRSGPGKKNARYRAQARRTFLSPTMTHLTAPFAYKFFVDGPCCDDEGNDVISRKRTNADVKSGLVRREFNELYGDTNYKNQWGSARVSNYGRDWDVSIVSWAAHNYRFSFILSTDDDALICTQNLLFQLSQPPFQTAATDRPFVLGFPRWDQFDNCFLLASYHVAVFFRDRYYELLRPTHTANSTRGATFGAAWSRKHGRWRAVLREHLSPAFTQRSGAPTCFRCGAVAPTHPCCKYEEGPSSIHHGTSSSFVFFRVPALCSDHSLPACSSRRPLAHRGSPPK
jgi:hypothetical protein